MGFQQGKNVSATSSVATTSGNISDSAGMKSRGLIIESPFIGMLANKSLHV
jgi:hypothetical protein